METVVMKAGRTTVEMLKGCRVTARAAQGVDFEPESLAAWSDMVSPGQMALDVGAYTGIYAIAARKLGALVFAFEPLTQQYERLMGNLLVNQVRLVTRQIAISDENGEAQFYFNPRVALTSAGSLVEQSGQAVTVRTRRLSDMEFPCRVAAIKIDVERAEDKVLRGAAALIDRDRPRILIEALDAEAAGRFGRLLPDYRLVGLLDGRNLLLEPA